MQLNENSLPRISLFQQNKEMQFMPVRKILYSLQTKHSIFEQKE